MATMTSGEPIAAKGRADTLVYPIAVARGQLVTALVAGFVATHIATVSGYWFHGVNLPDLGWPNFNGILLLGVKASPLAQFWTGAVFHFLTGMCFTLFYAFIVHPRLGRFPNTMRGNLTKAILFALVLATISAIWWVPQLFNSVFNYNFGWFSQNLGKFLGVSVWKAVLGIYVWHIIYGVNLGLIYNPHPAEPAAPPPAAGRGPLGAPGPRPSRRLEALSAASTGRPTSRGGRAPSTSARRA